MEVPFAGYDKRYEPDYAFDKAPAKNIKGILLIIGNNDKLFKVEDMEKLQQKQKKIVDKEVFIIENPDRKDNFRINKAMYFKTIRAFLAK